MFALLTIINFLLSLVFNLTFLLLWARVALRYFCVSSLHPISQIIYNFTEPLIKPIERAIYSKKIIINRYDWICFALIMITELIKFTLADLLIYRASIPFIHVIKFALLDLLIQPCDFFFYVLLIRVLINWVNPRWQHPIADVCRTITDPLLHWVRQHIPHRASGFDFSPYIIIVGLKVITLFLGAFLPYI